MASQVNAVEAGAKVLPVTSVQDFRRRNLAAWVQAQGGHASVAKKFVMSTSQASYLSQLVNGYSFGERAARSMEVRLSLPAGSLDRAPDGAAAPAPPPAAESSLSPLALEIAKLCDQLDAADAIKLRNAADVLVLAKTFDRAHEHAAAPTRKPIPDLPTPLVGSRRPKRQGHDG